jgi:hypothetical protein
MRFINFLVLSTVTLILSCKSEPIESKWIDNNVVADGIRNEWDDITVNYFEDEDVALGLCNDSANLCIIFSFRDIRWARAIRRSGLTLWFDQDGKKSKDFGVKYIGGPPPEELNNNFANNDRLETMFSNDSQIEKQLFSVVNDKGKRVDITPNGSQGPAAGFKLARNGIYTYEFIVPLKESELGLYGIGTVAGSSISIGAEWGGMNEEMRKKMREMMGEKRGGGMPGGDRPFGGGGRMPGDGRPGGGRPNGMMGEMEKQEIWLKVALADNREPETEASFTSEAKYDSTD